MVHYGVVQNISGVQMYPWLKVFHKLFTTFKRSLYIQLFCITCTFFSACDQTKNFDALLPELAGLTAQERVQALNAWLDNADSFPVVSDSVAWFFARSRRPIPLYLTGDFNRWSDSLTPFYNIVGTDVYYCRKVFPVDARLEYKIIRNGKWQRDSLNKHTARGSYGVNSVLFMPEYRYPVLALRLRNRDYTAPDTVDVRVSGITHRVWVYKHYRAAENAPLLIFLDGGDYLTYGAAGVILDNLIHDDLLQPVTAVFVQPKDRMKDYWLDKSYLALLMEVVVPDILGKYRLNPQKMFIGGVSLGGLTALYAMKDYHKRLDGFFAQSGAFWVDSLAVLKIMEKTDLADKKAALSVGRFERQDSVHSAVVRFLSQRGARVMFKEISDGHNWGNWRAGLGPLLTSLLSAKE